jgi:RNA polymerase sigma factor (sigma-70 family)
VTHIVMDYGIGMRQNTAQNRGTEVDPDLILVQRIAAQDQDALQALYDHHAPGLLRYLSGRLGDTRLAEEVLQDTMLAIWQSARRFRGECRVRTWLITIARLRAINAYHRQIAPSSLNDPFDDEDQRAAPRPNTLGQYLDLNAALLVLPEAQRETLELVFYHGLSLEETALVLQVATGTVKSRLHRAKNNLRRLMAAGNDEDDTAY